MSSVGTGPILLKIPYGAWGAILRINTNGDIGTSASTNYGNVGAKPAAITNYITADSISGNNQVIAFNTANNGGWYLWEDAISTNFPTFQGDTHTNTVIDNIASTTGLYPGQLITGTGIQAGTRIATITSATAITTTIATTASATITITKAAVAKIIDADYPSAPAGGMVSVDGYFFAADANGNIYQSALNNPSSWAASDVLNADYSGDELLFLFKVGDYIGAVGASGSIQYFYNAGNPSGSVLRAEPNLTLSGVGLLNAPMPFDGVYYCLGGAQTGSQNGAWGLAGLYRLSGANGFSRVSDDVWSSIIQDLSLTLISPAKIGNKHILILHSSLATVSVIYDPSLNQFSLLQLATAFTSGNMLSNAFTRASSSDILSWSTAIWTDEGVAYTLTAQTEPQDMNDGMDADDIWIDLLADNESSGTATLSRTLDDYVNWVTLGTFDMTTIKKRVYAGGMHNVAAYRIQHSANTGFRGQILRVNYKPSTT